MKKNCENIGINFLKAENKSTNAESLWGNTFGMCVDKFGTAWMINITATKAEDTPIGVNEKLGLCLGFLV